MAGRIHQINVSPGGVPKRSVPSGDVTELGIAGDDQVHKRVHGGPTRALCLYALERIEALKAEGHPVFPGGLGENITTEGVDWGAVEPGARLRLGPDVLIEVTGFAEPCRQIAYCFADRASERIAADRRPGWARAYARVLRTGAVRVGDEIELERLGAGRAEARRDDPAEATPRSA